MNVNGIISTLKQELGFDSTIIALQQAKEKPSDIEEYRDKNNICYMMCEVLEEKKTFYTIYENHVCTLGCTATGLDPVHNVLSDEERQASEEIHVGSINVFPTTEIQARAEKEATRLFPKFQEEFKSNYHGTL